MVSGKLSRTLPRVRELKLGINRPNTNLRKSRTLPRVRELKRHLRVHGDPYLYVAPLPECVN